MPVSDRIHRVRTRTTITYSLNPRGKLLKTITIKVKDKDTATLVTVRENTERVGDKTEYRDSLALQVSDLVTQRDEALATVNAEIDLLNLQIVEIEEL